MPTFSTRTPLIGLLALLLAGCAGPAEHFVLKPGADGSTGSMRATSREGKAFVLDAHQTGATSRGGNVAPTVLDAGKVQEMFQSALDAQPMQPTAYRLYFVEGSEQLTAESQAQMSAILDELKRRPAPDLVIVGHTDRVGKLEDNDKLALRRAEATRRLFESQGITADSIHTAGRGEREPLIQTADEIAEARNRRVEILVR